MPMNGRILAWSIAALATAAVVVGGCRKLPDPFEPIAGAGLATPALLAGHSTLVALPDFSALVQSCGAAVECGLVHGVGEQAERIPRRSD